MAPKQSSATPWGTAASRQSMTGRRPELREIISRISESSEGLQFSYLSEIDKLVDSTAGYRWQSPRTQQNQDRHLYLYSELMTVVCGLDKDTPHEEVYPHAFPEDHDKLLRYIAIFIAVAFKESKPRSRLTGSNIFYHSLAKYRDSMMFWVPRMYAKFNRTAPSTYKVFNRMTEIMRALSLDHREVFSVRATKTQLGIIELRQLIEHDMSMTRCIEVAEQHHLAWCIDRQFALRPGSIGAGPAHLEKDGLTKPRLTWGDIELSRSPDDPGKFNARITIHTFKQSRDPETRSVEPRVFFSQSPARPENLLFSIPHRLLVMALRRNILLGFSKVEDLFKKDNTNFQIAVHALKEPVFYSATQRGLALDNSKPLTALALTEYIRLREQNIGYQLPVTFYSIRRRAGTDLAMRYGNDIARDAMAHSAETRTFEQYYLDTRAACDATSASLNEPTGTGGWSEAQRNLTSLGLTKLDQKRLSRTKGEALRQLVRYKMDNDEEFPGVDSSDFENYRRRLQRAAYRKLNAKEHELQQQEMTTGEAQSRSQVLINASAFADALRLAAKNMDDEVEQEPETEVEHRQIDQRIEEPDEDSDDEDSEDGLFVKPSSEEIEGIVDEGVDELPDETDEDPEVSATSMEVDIEQLPWATRSQLAMDLIPGRSRVDARAWLHMG